MDVAEYRKQMRVQYTTKSGHAFTIRRVSAPRLVTLFREAGIAIGSQAENLPPEKGIEMAVRLLPDVVEEIRPEGKGDDTHIGIEELAMADATELFAEAMRISGVTEEAIAKAKAFREPPAG